MKGIARLSFHDGGLFLPVRTPYDHEVLFEYADRYAKRYGRVRLEIDRHECTVRRRSVAFTVTSVVVVVAVLSSVVPYAVEQVVLRRVTPATFAVLLALLQTVLLRSLPFPGADRFVRIAIPFDGMLVSVWVTYLVTPTGFTYSALTVVELPPSLRI